MADPTEKVILEVGIDPSPLQRGLNSVRNRAEKTWAGISKATLKYGRAIKQVSAIGATSTQRLLKERKLIEATTGRSIASLRDEASEYRKVYDRYSDHIKELRKEQHNASDVRKKEIKNEIDDIKRLQKVSLGEFKRSQGGTDRGPDKSDKGKGAGAGALAVAGMAAAVTGMVKGLGSLTKSLAPLLSSFGKLAPLIGAFTSGITGIVQLMIDAEASAKAMNKEILQASGSSMFLDRNLGRGKAALADMEDTLSQIRDEATSLSNISWGISKEDHLAMLGTLSAEGVKLTDLQSQFEAMGKDSSLAAAHAKSFGGAVQVAIGYSRVFGVSLQELTQFQAEMMTELGSSLADSQLQFEKMRRSAAESGIATNKFFAMIRGVSSDLSLYNSRLEDAYKILGMLGKVMNPRNAQRFMQTAMQALKGMGRIDRLKLNLLGGGKMGGMVDRDLKRKSEGLAGKIRSATGKEVSPQDLLDSNKNIGDLLQGVADSQKGEFTEAILEMRTDAKMNKKGIYGQSVAGRNLGPGAALEAMKSALKPFAGGAKKLMDMRGTIGAEQMAEQLGISEEQLSSMVKFEYAIDEQRELLKKGIASNDPKVMASIAKAGLKANEIDSAGYDQIMDTMDENEKEALKHSGEVIDYAKETSKTTSTISDKIGQLVDFVMNQIYNVMTGIWDTIMDIASSKLFDPSGAKAAEHAKARLEMRVNKTRNAELMDLVGKSQSEQEFKIKLKDTESYKAMGASIGKGREVADLNSSLNDLGKRIQQTSDPAQRKKLEADYETQKKKLEAVSAEYNAAVGNIEKQLSGTLDPNSADGRNARATRVSGAINSLFGPNTDFNKQKIATQRMGEGSDVNSALKAAGFSVEEISKIMDKLRDTLSGEEQAQALSDYLKQRGMVSAPSPTGPAPQEAPKPSAAPPPAPVASTPSTPTSPAAPPPPTAAAVAAASKVEPPMTKEQGDSTLSTLDSVEKVLSHKGIKMNQAFMRDKFWASGHDAVLDANRESLFEYFMYSKLADPQKVAEGLKDKTISPNDFGRNLVSSMQSGTDFKTIPGFAKGGIVPEPKSPDSVFVAARPGETILPKGKEASGSGSLQINVPVNVNGPGAQELGDMIKIKAMDAIQEWRRKQRLI